MPDNADALLVKKCLEGNQQAMKELYDRHKAPMYSLCLRYANDSFEAQDFLQEGFIKVFADLGQFQGTGALGGWIRQVVVRTILQKMRQRKLNFAETEVESLANQYASNEGVLQQFREQAILKMVQALPDGFRLVFNMYVMEGYSHKEIASQLNISEGTSKSQLSRAKEALRKVLEKEFS